MSEEEDRVSQVVTLELRCYAQDCEYDDRETCFGCKYNYETDYRVVEVVKDMRHNPAFSNGL